MGFVTLDGTDGKENFATTVKGYGRSLLAAYLGELELMRGNPD